MSLRPAKPIKLTANAADRFKTKYVVNPDNGCWEWKACLGRNCYGGFQLRGSNYRAHRVSWVIHNGQDVPPGLYVCHHCDNKKCVNPAHLWLGTHNDNVQDMHRKGKGPDMKWGNGSNTITVEQVREIKRSDLSNKQLSQKYKILPQTVWKIKTGKLWGYVDV